jgi:bacillolysin
MKKILFLSFVSAIIIVQIAQAQTILKKLQDIKGLHPTYLEFNAADAPAFIKDNVWVLNEKDKIVQQAAKLLRSSNDALGYTGYRYQQILNNIPVEDAVYVLHVKSGKVLSENGRWAKEFPANLPTGAALNEAAALQSALHSINAKVYKWQNAAAENMLKEETGDPNATYYPKGKLVYYAAGEEISAQNLRLAYKFDVYATTPLVHEVVFIDAMNGAVLGAKNLIQTIGGTGKTVYSGTQNINTATGAGGTKYILKDKVRGSGVVTMNLKKGTDYGAAVNFFDDDNNWNNVNAAKDQYATDAHWGAEMTYDFYKNIFNRNSIDDNGFALRSYVHYDVNYYNAFWDGQEMTYGDGDGNDNFKPLTALDVCGHEITHGMTSFTAALNYSGESGALNEGFSDIFGTCIEFYARPSNANWLMGGDFGAIRDMSHPNAYSQPDTYKGTYWINTNSSYDNGGVHFNSGVLNYWFYLLTAGGSGTNDKGVAYSVTGIGIAKAQAIAYRTLTNYLVPSSQYADARTYSIQAAKDLYGATSVEVTQVKNAWKAVGVKATAAAATIESDAPIAAVESPTLKSAASDIKVFSIYPNPVKNRFTIEFTQAKAGNVYLAVYSMSGTKIYRQVIAAGAGANRVPVSLPSMSAGTYIVKLNNNKVKTIQVVQ